MKILQTVTNELLEVHEGPWIITMNPLTGITDLCHGKDLSAIHNGCKILEVVPYQVVEDGEVLYYISTSEMDTGVYEKVEQ